MITQLDLLSSAASYFTDAFKNDYWDGTYVSMFLQSNDIRKVYFLYHVFSYVSQSDFCSLFCSHTRCRHVRLFGCEFLYGELCTIYSRGIRICLFQNLQNKTRI